MFDAFIFYSTLIVSITLACYYKRIDDLETKRNYGTGIGIIIACLICGFKIFHTVLMVCGNIIITKFCDKRYIHVVSLGWTWLYLLYIHIHLVNPGYVIWMHQTISLRYLVSITNLTRITMPKSHGIVVVDKGYLTTVVANDDFVGPVEVEPLADSSKMKYLPTVGPYYKWKIFKEYLNGSFGLLGDCRIITEQKLKKMFICLAGYALLRIKYTPYIYYDDSFYTSYNMDSRYLYNIPLLLMFVLKSQIISLLATSACTEAGFGVYPAKCQPLPGLGPSARHSLLKLSGTPDKALEQEYNFSMLKCFENDRLLVGPRMKDTMKSWNMSTRYWFWAYIYKNLVKADKEVRSICSHLAWTLWSGPSLQQLLISSTLWVYIHLEAEYGEFYETNASMKVPWDIGFSIMRMFCLIYLTPCFIVTEAATLLKYYNSIFWVFHGILIVFIVGAIVIYKNR